MAGLLSAAVTHTEQRLHFLCSSCFPSDGSFFFCGGKGRCMSQRRDVPFAMRKGTCGSHITKVCLFKSQQQRSTMALKSQETGSDPVAITVNANINTIFLQPHVNSGCCYAMLSASQSISSCSQTVCYKRLQFTLVLLLYIIPGLILSQELISPTQTLISHCLQFAWAKER